MAVPSHLCPFGLKARDLRRHFGKAVPAPQAISHAPVIAMPGMAMTGALVKLRGAEWFAAVATCLLALP